MKKLLWVGFLAGAVQVSPAITVNAPSALVGSQVLNGIYAYEWGIPISLQSGQQITSATVTYNNVTLNIANSSGTGYLYTDILNLNNTGVTTVTDNDQAGDYFASHLSSGNFRSLGTKFFPSVGTTFSSITYSLSSSQLTSLNSWVSDGIFDIGIDPDCHFSVGGLSFSYTLTPTSQNPPGVPDAGNTVALLALGLAGLAGTQLVWRRKASLA